MANMLTLLGMLAVMTPLKDPTTPLAGGQLQGDTQQVAVAGMPKLQSIILGNGPAIAVLSGKGYRHGEQVAGWRVAGISSDRVVLDKGQERVTLTLFADKILR